MAYFVTGGTGFIGRFLVQDVLKRGEPVYVLVRKSSQKKLDELRETWGVDTKRVIGIVDAEAKPKGFYGAERLAKVAALAMVATEVLP